MPSPIDLSTFPVCALPEVLNPWERHLFNALEAYFFLRQNQGHRMPVLPQVGLSRFLRLPAPMFNGVQVNAMSVDFLLVSGDLSAPRLVIEADGRFHADDPAQQARDQLKDALLAQAGIPCLRLNVVGIKPHLAVLQAEVEIDAFERTLSYPMQDVFGQGYALDLSAPTYDPAERAIEQLDLELALVQLGWAFPDGWDYVSKLWLTHQQHRGVWRRR